MPLISHTLLQTSSIVSDVGRIGSVGTTAPPKQRFCGDAEGWGPISAIRYDFTPCFLDVWICVVAVYGLLGGAAAIWWLLRRNNPRPVPKDWHLYLKLVGLLVFSVEDRCCSVLTHSDRPGRLDLHDRSADGLTAGCLWSGLVCRCSVLDHGPDSGTLSAAWTLHCSFLP